ncbi:Bromo domain-containing protein [Mycena sanguinolenta]|uniref:Bromo domain-containing protein n=1 Tax=Mycena sanguinolenta TaxID=230812 RepID=A0A8H7D1J8_9AGAR|nr:Bromo domain-containing protein [Mycena sanguinolenta]
MSRSRRSKSQVSAAAEGVSVLDKLVLAQAVWEVGTSSWLKISRILGKHALLTHPKTFFTAQSCHAMYNHMMKESGFELSDANNVAHAPVHFKLAEKYYAERVEELRTLISAEEQQFKAIVAEIDQIRAGQRDEEIKARITGIPAPEKEEDSPEDEFSAPAEESADITMDQDVPPASATPKDEAPEIEMPVPDSETIEPEEPTADIPAIPPTPEAAVEGVVEAAVEDVVEAVVEDVAPQQSEAKVSTEPTPTPEAPLSPPENLDHLMQQPTWPPEETVSEPAVVDIKAELIDAPNDEAEPIDAPNDEAEPIDAPNDEADIEQPQSKPVSQASESGATEEGISTRRSTRRRPSISTAPPPVAKKRGRRAKSPELEAEPEPQPTPTPAAKEETPAVDETQPDEEMPMSAAVRRREGEFLMCFSIDSPRATKRAREESEPVDDDEQGSTARRRPTGRTEEQVALKRFQTVITMVHSQISQHRNGNIFHNPIKVSEAPDYHDIVKRPIDLKTIKAKIKDGVIGNSLEYQRDIYLMFANAMMYNRPGSDVHAMAEDMMVESDSHINTFRQTEGYVKSR